MKLYHHKTDGGAEYLCAKPIEGTDDGDLSTAVVRLDGEPELISLPEPISDLYFAASTTAHRNPALFDALVKCAELGIL